MVAEGALPDAAFDRLMSVEDQSFWFRSRNRILNWALRSYFPAATSFLEVGCGNGYVLGGIASEHAALEVVGTDLSEAALRHAAERAPSARLVRADARELPFEADFDVVGAFDVIEHIVQDDRVLAEMSRAAKPHGGVILTVPQHPWLWSKTDHFSGHQRRYRRKHLVGKLLTAGLKPRHITSFVTLLLPVMIASRAWGAVSRAPFDPVRELAVASWLDTGLERVMAIEQTMIEAGLRLPVGGSLLVIADRVQG